MTDEFANALAAYRAQPTPEGRRQFLELCYPLLQQVARSIHRTIPRSASVEVDDLVSDGVSGACAALDAFDDSKGCTFKTYAILRIRGAILDALRNRDWVPRLAHRQAAAGGDDVRKMLNVDWSEKTHRDGEWIPGTSLEPAASPEPVRDDDFWTELLRGMNQRERLFVLLYWREQLTMREVGEHFGLSESRVSQIQSRLLVRMRETLAAPRRRQQSLAAWRPLPRPAPALTPELPLHDYVTPPPSPLPPVERISAVSNISAMVDQLAGLPLEEIDAEIAATKQRLDLLQRMRTIVGGKPASPNRGGRKKADPPAETFPEIDESIPFDDSSIERTVRVRRYVKAKGPSRPVAIAEACGIPLGSITAVINRTPGIVRNDDGLLALAGE